jgi:hypothetical protein
MFATQGTALIIEIIIGTSTILAGVAGAIKWLTKHYFDEIRAELKPNSGSSLKDQVGRIEIQQKTFQSRLDEADQMRRDMDKKLDKMYIILLDHVAKNKE